jgi:hypothetical protein
MKIVFLTGQFSPFQLELAESLNANQEVCYKVVFTEPVNRRPAHWLKVERNLAVHGMRAPERAAREWLDEVLQRERPQIVLVGGIRGIQTAAALAYRRRNKATARVGLWLEPPNEQPNRIFRIARTLEYAIRLRGADFVLAIGPNTAMRYRRWQKNTFMVPYGENLKKCFAVPLPRPRVRRMRFLFSGGLEPRHNFPVTLAAFERLYASHGPCFEFVISGHGSEQPLLDAVLSRQPNLARLTRAGAKARRR